MNMHPIFEKLSGHIDYVFHLGDTCTDVRPFIPLYPNITFYAVSGNCDFAEYAPKELLVNIYGYNFFLTHGSSFGVKYNKDKISYAAMERGADVCLFGHTHYPELYKQENIIFMNPGSIVLPRGTKYHSYGMVNFFEDKGPEFSIVSIEKNGSNVIKFLSYS
ncbi:MAG: metallophosphoesterase [Clostridiales bacterium]|jgi:putative phosphoesterase|nr:metallophosphoesterase [Clostridiales bacterium]